MPVVFKLPATALTCMFSFSVLERAAADSRYSVSATIMTDSSVRQDIQTMTELTANEKGGNVFL